MGKRSKARTPPKVARLRARLEVLTGKGTEQMRASLQAQIDELESHRAPLDDQGGESDRDR